MNKKRIIVSLSLLIAFLSVTGCRWFNEEQYETIEVPTERLEQIDELDFETVSVKPEQIKPSDLPVDHEPNEMALSIEQCRAFALQNNLDLNVQLFNPDIARESVTEAKARFEPLAFSSFNFIKTDTPIDTELEASTSESAFTDLGMRIPLRSGGEITLHSPFSRNKTDNQFATLNPSYTHDAVLQLSQPLLRGAGVKTNTHVIRLAGYDEKISLARTKLEIIRVLATVDRVYWRLYAVLREQQVRKQEYDLAKAQLESAKRMVKAGQVSEIEIIRSEEAMAMRLEAIIISENTVKDRQRDLKRIMNELGLKLESKTILMPATEPNPTYYALDRQRLLDYALKQRMEFLELELQIARDTSLIEFERNGTLPLFSVDYTYNINGLGDNGYDAYDMMLDNQFVDHRVGLALQVPLGNQAAKSRLRRSILQRLQRYASRSLREIAIKQEVLNAADQLETNWQRVVASEKTAHLSGRTLEAEQRRFELGLQTSTEVLDAQTRFADAQLSHIRALVEYQIAQVDLAFATGSLTGAAKVHWDSKTHQRMYE